MSNSGQTFSGLHNKLTLPAPTRTTTFKAIELFSSRNWPQQTDPVVQRHFQYLRQFALRGLLSRVLFTAAL